MQQFFRQNKYAKHHLKDFLQISVFKCTYELRPPIQGTWVLFASFHPLFDCGTLYRWSVYFLHPPLMLAHVSEQQLWIPPENMSFSAEFLLTLKRSLHVWQISYSNHIFITWLLLCIAWTTWWYFLGDTATRIYDLLPHFVKYDCLEKVWNCIFCGNQKTSYPQNLLPTSLENILFFFPVFGDIFLCNNKMRENFSTFFWCLSHLS